MYEKFFYLKENPFNITPDPKFLYLSRKHQEALDLLYFGTSQRKGFILLSGEVGTGKTTLCRALLDKLNSTVQSALVLNPLLSDIELIMAINEDFGLKVNSVSLKEQLDTLNSFLLKKIQNNENAVVIVDEAQNLSLKALEMIRLLSNLETEKMKLLQIILVGQPELRDKLKLPELRQLNQRIVVRYHLGSLSFDETKAYIFRRLTIAGGKGNIRFTSSALQSIYEASSGIPRLINIICDRTLTAAFVAGKRVVDDEIERRAIDELDRDGTLRKDIDIVPEKRRNRYRLTLRYAAASLAVAIVIIVITALWWGNKKTESTLSHEMTPVAETITDLENASKSVPAEDLYIQSSLPDADVNIQKTTVVNAGTAFEGKNTGVDSLSSRTELGNSKASLEPSQLPDIPTDERDSANQAGYTGKGTIFKELLINVNANKTTVAASGTMEVSKGDKIKIVDAVVEGAERKDISVNFLGFVGSRNVNTGEDRGYLIDTSKDLLVKYSVNGEGREYPVVVKHGDIQIGEIFVKIKEPESKKK